MESLKGKLLLASPTLLDPNFARTVVLVAEHTEEGAMGLVLNRPAAATVGEAVPDLSWLAGDEEPVFVGGPVAETAVIVLAEFDRPDMAGALVEDDLGFIGTDADDPDVLDGAIRRARVFASSTMTRRLTTKKVRRPTVRCATGRASCTASAKTAISKHAVLPLAVGRSMDDGQLPSQT